jgi:chaperonin GroEL
MCKKEGGFRPLMIIAGDIESTAQAFLVQNIKKNKLPVVVIKSPLAGNQRYDILEDIAAATGAQIFSKIDGKLSGYGKRQGKVPEKVFGRAESAEVTLTSTRIMTMDDREKAIKAHVERIRELDDSEHNQKRISKLTNGMGIIYIGGYTNVESRYNDQVIDDAVNAAQSAMKNGIVPGGGHVFTQAFNRAIGGAGNRMETVLRAGMYAPLNQLLENSEMTYMEYLDLAGADGIDTSNHVLNLETMEFEPISTTSILDSAGVAKQCIINSVSLVGEIVDTKYAII